MDETLKYFKLSGGDMGDKQVVVACKPEQEDAMRKKFEGYELEECEAPVNARMVEAEPYIPWSIVQEYRKIASVYDPFVNVKHAIYDGPNCGRCANRFRRSDYCSTHCHSTKPCYRFKMEK